MPYAKQIEHLKTYGPLATKLDELVDAIYETDYDDRNRSRILTTKLFKYCQQKDTPYLLARLADDKYAYSRELVSCVLRYLWESGKYKHIKDRDAYEAWRIEFCKELAWTLPLIEKLLHDTTILSVEIAIRAASEAGDMSQSFRSRDMHELGPIQDKMLELTTHRSPRVRQQAVNYLASVFPYDDDSMVADIRVHDALIKACYDSDAEVRNWAYFELHIHVANLDDATKQAFLHGLHTEAAESENYLEAVNGLARMGYSELVDEIIIARLRTGEAGSGWIDAAEYSHTTDCLDALFALRQWLAEHFPEDNQIETITLVLYYWND